MPSEYWMKLENTLRSVDPNTAQAIRRLAGLIASDETGPLADLLMEGEHLRDRVRLRAILDGGICARGAGAARLDVPPEEIRALCVAMGNAVGGPGEAPLTSLLRRLAPDHPVLARLEELAREHAR